MDGVIANAMVTSVLINKNDVPSSLANSLGRIQRRAESNKYRTLMLFKINTIYYFHHVSSNILSCFRDIACKLLLD